MSSEPSVDLDTFDWVQLKADLDAPHASNDESSKDKFFRKFKDNPLVPIGSLVTVSALFYGLYAFRTGDQRTSQKMMRLRIGAQGFTVAALLGGLYVATTKTQTPA